MIDQDQVAYDLRIHHPKSGDFFVLYIDGGLSSPEMSRLEAKLPAGVTLAVLDPNDRLELFTAERLRELGLQRTRR